MFSSPIYPYYDDSTYIIVFDFMSYMCTICCYSLILLMCTFRRCAKDSFVTVHERS